MLDSSPLKRPYLVVNQTIGSLFNDFLASAENTCRFVVFSGVSYWRSPFIFRLLTWLVFTFQLAFHLTFFGHGYRSIFVVSNPPLAPLLAPLARRPYVLLLYDLYPQVLAQLQLSNPLQSYAISLIIKLWHRANRYVFPKADLVFTLSSAMANQIRDYFPTEALWRDRVVVIPPWADTKTMRPCPEEASNFRHFHDIQGLLLTYSGNLGLTHPLEPLLEASALLSTLSSRPKVQTLLIGNGPKRTQLESLAHSLDLSHGTLRFLDPLPYSEVPSSLSAADLAVVALDGPSSASSLPSKTFNALACGTPILALAPSLSALSQLVRYHHCGFVIEPGPYASKHLLELMINLSTNPFQLKQLSLNALAASSFYSPRNADRMVEAWLGLGGVS